MGLLDNLDPSTETGQRFLGLLAAAGPQTDPTKTSYAARLKMAEDGVQDWKQNKLMGEYRQAQMDAQKRQLAAQEAQAKQAAVQQEALGKLFNLTGGGGGFSPATDGVFDGSMKYTQPTPQKLQLNQQAVLEAARLGVDPKRLQEYADLQNIGMAEVARTIDGRDSDGRPVTYQKDKYGRDVASPVAQWKAPEYRDTGGAITAIDTITNKPILQLPKTQSPDSKASNAVAWANNAVSRERLDFDKSGGAEAVKQSRPEWKDGRWVVPPKDMKPGETRAVNPVVSTKDAKDALMIIGEAEKYIDQATGSGVGTGLDWLGRAVGYSTKGDTAIGQLKALEGVLVSKMPKMSGPQSDKDVALYKQMAAEIGDPMMPNSRKKAALQVVKQIQQKYADQGQSGASGSWGQGQFKILSVE